jgi:superfamily II DNA or RNA helicase
LFCEEGEDPILIMARPSSVLTVKGYSFLKKDITPTEEAYLRKTMTLTPKTPPSFSATIKSFSVLMESSQRFYVPRAWATKRYGPAMRDDIPEGDRLRSELQFAGSPRDHQIKAIQAFQDAGCGILCLPCGYGKTFTAIAIALRLGLRFLVVVHKEFLLDQWSGELKALVPGIRIGRVQGERLDIGPEYDVAIAMIQTICSRTYPAGTFASFGLAIFDEAHHLGAEHFSQTLQRIQCKHMLGLTATPQRSDGLTKVFEWFLGPIVFQIDKRDADDTVRVEVLRFTSNDTAYCTPPTNYRGEVIRARLLNRIAEHVPRTTAILDWVHGHLQVPGRKLLILSDRREHLMAFETGVKQRGHTSVSYYVGGMKQSDLDKSAESQIILATYAMAAEGLNIPTLNTVLLATPKSNVEQSIGRILRQRPEERLVAPLILDVLDTNFQECYGQYNKRKKTYKSADYRIRFAGDPDSSESEEESEPEEATCLIADD